MIEVAESSLAFDRGEKADLYASARIQEYWVVDIASQCIEVRRKPSRQGYRELQTFTGDDEIRPLAAPDAVLRPKMLFE